MRDDAVLRRALPLGRGLGRTVKPVCVYTSIIQTLITIVFIIDYVLLYINICLLMFICTMVSTVIVK